MGALLSGASRGGLGTEGVALLASAGNLAIQLVTCQIICDKPTDRLVSEN